MQKIPLDKFQQEWIVAEDTNNIHQNENAEHNDVMDISSSSNSFTSHAKQVFQVSFMILT